jgi:hypothetical protein
MRRLHLAIVATAALAALAALALPGLAAAKPHHKHPGRSALAELHTRGSNGYRISVFSIGPKDVALFVDKGAFSISYELHGRVTTRGLEANLGKLGHISLRFHVSSRHSETLTHDGGCPASRIVDERGVFRGSFNFRGEQGFTTVSTHHVRGEVSWATNPSCSSRSARASSARVPRLLRASAKKHASYSAVIADHHSNGRDTFFEALKEFPEDDEDWELYAAIDERRGRIEIQRDALVFAGPNMVTVSDPGVHPASAGVMAKAPLQGSATFTESPIAPALPWEGSLRISMPGIGAVPLTGQGFHTTVCSEKSFNRLLDCQEAAL